MTHFTFLAIVVATVANALLISFCRLNNDYHALELITIGTYTFFGWLLSKTKKNQWFNWIIVVIGIRFSFYSAIWGYVAYKNPLYLGDDAWTDRLIKTVLYDWMNQSPGALGYLYVLIGIFSVLMYLRIYFNSKENG